MTLSMAILCTHRFVKVPPVIVDPEHVTVANEHITFVKVAAVATSILTDINSNKTTL